MFIDTHTHLYSEEFDADRNEIIKNAITKGITKLYLPNVDSTSIDGMLQLEKELPSILNRKNYTLNALTKV
jgi:TatD DNase family protein